MFSAFDSHLGLAYHEEYGDNWPAEHMHRGTQQVVLGSSFPSQTSDAKKKKKIWIVFFFFFFFLIDFFF